MLTITNYHLRNREDGSSFFSLEIEGGLEMVQSQQTGRFYATVKKVFITSTFDESTCAKLIGTSIPGAIAKEDCDPYQYTHKETGEIITMTTQNVYIPQELLPLTEESPEAVPVGMLKPINSSEAETHF